MKQSPTKMKAQTAFVLFLAAFFLVTPVLGVYHFATDINLIGNVTHLLGDEWFKTTSTYATITAWFVNNWVNYTVPGAGIQQIYNGTKPKLVYINGVSAYEGSGWGYMLGIITITGATSSASIYWGTVAVDYPPVAGTHNINSTTVNTPCEVTITWTDDNGLRFGWVGTNTTGSWVNQTAIALTGVLDDFVDTFTLPSLVGQIVGYKLYANDSIGQVTIHPTLTLTTTSSLLTVIYGANSHVSQSLCTFYIYIISPPDVTYAIAGCNASGLTINETAIAVSSVPCWINYTTALPYQGVIQYQFWLNSVAGWNQTGPIIFTIVPMTPIVDPPYEGLMPRTYLEPTWYDRSDTHTTGNLTGYSLNATNTVSEHNFTVYSMGSKSVQWGWRWWWFDSINGSSEVSLGYPTAILSRTTTGDGTQSNYWTPWRRNFDPGFTAIVGRLYVRFDNGAWQLVAVFQTDRLLYKKVMEDVWTVTVYTSRTTNATHTIASCSWGSSSYASRIEGIRLMNLRDDERIGFDWASGNLVMAVLRGFLLPFGAYWNVMYAMFAMLILGPLYMRYRKLDPILVLLVLFGGVGGFFGVLVGDVTSGLVWVVVLFSLAGLLYKFGR